MWLRTTHGRFVRDLERRRRLVIAELDIALAEYMAARLAAGSGTAVQPKSGVQPGLAAQPERAGEERGG
jgi:hypothetical protein